MDEEAYQRWLAGRQHVLSPAVDLHQPSLKSIVALALLDSGGKPVSYTALKARILKSNVLRSKGATGRIEIPVPALRVAVSELGRHLSEHNHSLRLKARKEGKEARFEMVSGLPEPAPPTPGARLDAGAKAIASYCQIIAGRTTVATDPNEIAQGLIRDGGGLPFASFYSNYRTAAQWLAYSSHLGSTKKNYEAESFYAYGLQDELLKGEGPHSLGVLGLGPGEGLGEVELLDRILRAENAKKIKCVHYLAVDTSELLLTSHVCLIRERFHREIAEGRLVFAPVLGDIFQLGAQIEAARTARGAHFLADIPIVATYFGNSLGNHEGHEWDFFRTVFTAIPKPTPLAVLTGVSLLRWRNDRRGGEPIDDIYHMDAFTLETPRHLLYEMGLLESLDDAGKPIPGEQSPEFTVAEDKAERIPPEIYSNPFGVAGRVYRFKYALKNDIRTRDGAYFMKRGSRILLYSIIKYDLPSLIGFLEGRGPVTKAPPRHYSILSQSNGEEEYRYAVIASVRK